jgi:phosphatidate cytidylyltransferase
MPTEIVIRSSMAAVAVLGSTGITVLVVEKARRRSLSSSILVTRWKTWVVLATIWMLGLASPAVLYVVLAAVGLVGASEYARIARLGWTDGLTLLVLPVVALSLVAVGVDPFLVAAGAMLASTVGPLLEQDLEDGPQRIGRLLLGLTVLAIPAISMWAVSQSSPVAFVALLFGVALSDVAAFTVGSTLGRRRLASQLSPNKTWEGVGGNLIGAVIGTAIAGVPGGLGIASTAVLGIVIGSGAVWGDLLESLIKRNANVKDAGTVLPGFGGVLDRVDSLIVAAPLTWIVLQVLGGGL